MQPPAGIADQRGEPVLDVHVYVFQRGTEVEAPAFKLFPNRIETLENGVSVLGRDDFARNQHAAMGL